MSRPNFARALTYLSVLAFFPWAGRLAGQQSSLPPIRPIGPVTARAKDTIGEVGQLIALRDGRVVVNDTRRKRLFLLDSSLSHPVVIADTSSDTKKAYGQLGGTAFLYRGDTILFADVASLAILVIDPAGHIVRVTAFPRPADARLFRNPAPGGIDPEGRLVYIVPGGAPCGDPTTSDSNPVVRASLVTRVIDTAGYSRYPKCPDRSSAAATSLGFASGYTLFNRADDWTLLADGTLAFVRGQDFTIDWVDPNGTHRSTPRIAHDWRHLTDADRAAIVDTLASFLQAHPKQVTLGMGADGQPARHSLTAPDPALLPDYLPAFAAPGKADADGNLWMRDALPWSLTLSLMGGAPVAAPPVVYTVINRKGELVDRVRIPGGTDLVAFGPGVAYLKSRDGATTGLVRVRIR